MVVAPHPDQPLGDLAQQADAVLDRAAIIVVAQVGRGAQELVDQLAIGGMDLHAVETGALRPGEQLPGIRPLAEELVINPNTVAKAYRELEHEGVIELRHGAGAFVSATARTKTPTDTRAAQAIVAAAVEKLPARGVTDEEIRRLVEAELAGIRKAGAKGGVSRG